MSVDSAWVEASATVLGVVFIPIGAAIWKLHGDRIKQSVEIDRHGERIQALEKSQEAQNVQLGQVREGMSRMEGKLDEGFKWIRDCLASLGNHRDDS